MRHLLALLMGLFVLVACRPARADFVNRSTRTVAWAIGVGPGGSALSSELRRRYAAWLIDVAREHDFDPFTGIAIIEHESRWRASAVSPDGEDMGLAQIRARFRPGCTDDADPVHAPDQECQAAKARLLNPLASMKAMGHAISLWRTLCKNGATGAAAPVVGGLRGDAPAEQRPSVWPAEGPGQVARPAHAQGGAVDRPAPQSPAPSTAPAPTQLSPWGHNYRLGSKDLDRAVLAHVLERAKRESKAPPCEGDMLQFVERSQVVLLDKHGRQVEIDRVVVAWEER
jgi:hypothetical protein